MNKDEKAGLLVRTDPGIPVQRADMQGLVHRASDTGLDNDILDLQAEKREKYIVSGEHKEPVFANAVGGGSKRMTSGARPYEHNMNKIEPIVR